MNSVEDFLWTLAQFRCEVCPEAHHLPSIHDIYIVLLCGGLNGSDFLVGDDFSGVIVGNMSKVAFSNEEACFRRDGVYVLLKLIRAISFCNLLRATVDAYRFPDT
jgi:hypothetical protein